MKAVLFKNNLCDDVIANNHVEILHYLQSIHPDAAYKGFVSYENSVTLFLEWGGATEQYIIKYVKEL